MSEPDVWSALLEAAAAGRKRARDGDLDARFRAAPCGRQMLIDLEQGLVGTIGGGAAKRKCSMRRAR
jgi:hypothetical protein